MGNQGASKWQDDYEFIENIAASRIRVRHKTTDNFYEIATLSVSDHQRQEMQSRVARRDSDRSIYVQSIIRFSEKVQRTVCSNTQTYELVLRESSPTLADHCRYRRLKNRHFSSQEILLVIRNACLGLAYLKSIGERHGQIDLSTIIVNRQIYIKDPILVQGENGESLGFRKSVRGFPSPQKLREYYDCLINFDEYSSDLFSVGVVALQMAHLERDMRQIYTIKNPQYDNNQINFRVLHELVHAVKDGEVKEWIRTLLHPQERYRKNVQQRLNGFRVNSSQLRILKDNPLRVAPEEELVEPIQPYVEESEVPNNLTNANRSSSYILPVSHQTTHYPRPTLINQSFPISAIRENRSIVDSKPPEMSVRSISLPKTTSYHTQSFTETRPIKTYSPLNFSFPKPPETITQSKYQPATLQDSKLDLSSLSLSFSKLSANLKSLIQSQEQQLKNKYVPVDIAPRTNLANLPEAPAKAPKKRQTRYSELAVPVIPEVQQDHSNMTESEYVVEEYQIGTKYEGLKKNGKRNGTGKFFYSQGSYYDGEWKDNKMHGFGTLTYPNGTIAYRGQWKDDEFQGKGTLYNNDPSPIARMYDYTDMSQIDSVWIMYQGEMQRGKRHGTGKLMLMNGQSYEGQFCEGKVQGRGTFHTLSGAAVSGVWRESALQQLQN